MTEKENNEITLKLKIEEALVLFDFISRFNETSKTEIFQDQAEQKALWILEGQLEKLLTEPFKPNYKDIINQARNKIRDEE
jgi:hypothetical protein